MRGRAEKGERLDEKDENDRGKDGTKRKEGEEDFKRRREDEPTRKGLKRR
jgi:hypothetical protein